MKKLQRDIHAEQFADYLIRRLRETGLRKSEVAQKANVSRQTIGQIAGKKAHHLTGKLMLPERETVDAIARALGDPIAEARATAGYSDPETATPDSRLESIIDILSDIPEEVLPLVQDVIKTIRERAIKDKYRVSRQSGTKPDRELHPVANVKESNKS